MSLLPGLRGQSQGDLTVPYLAPAAAPVAFTFRRPGGEAPKPKTTKTEKEGLEALAKAISAHGIVAAEGCGLPEDIATASEAEWRAAFEAIHVGESDACRMAFKRVVKTLVENEQLNAHNGRCWASK